MTVESATYANELNPALPDGNDSKSEGDNHIRLIKNVIQQTFPNLAGRAWRTQTKSAGYTAIPSDNMTMLRFTTSATLTLTAAATLGNGWIALVTGDGGDVTVDGDGVEKINAATTATVPDGHIGILICSNVASDEFYLMILPQGQAGAPPGSIMDFAGSSAPAGWALCFGQAISRTTFATLFGVIGTTFGVGDGSTTFNLPDCRGRVSAGKDDMGGSSANRLTNQSGGLNGDTLGATGGSEVHTLTTAQTQAHSHTDYYQSNSQNPITTYISEGWVVSGTAVAYPIGELAGSTTNSSVGSGEAHNNVQPTIIFNKIIKT